MSSTYRLSADALRRALAVVAAVALAVALMPFAGVASADEHEDLADLPGLRDLGDACEFVDDVPEFDDIGGLADDTQAAIECLLFYGITTGTSVDPPLYSPNDEVQRIDMAVFLSRLIGYAVDNTDIEAPEVEDQEFIDLDGYSDEQVAAVNLLGTLGVTTGTSEDPKE